MIAPLIAMLATMALRVSAGLAQTASVAHDDNHQNATNVISNPVTQVAAPTRVRHSRTSGGHQFVGRDGYLSEFHGSHLPHLTPRKHLTVFNPNNGLEYHTTLNDYLKTPVPGIHICDKTGFKGNCVYQQVVPNPVICQQLPKGPTQTMGSFLVEKDIQCAFHSDKNCRGGHTPGRYLYPMTNELRSKWDGLTGDILAYKCRQCDGCDASLQHPDWDGNSVQELSPAGGIGGMHISKDQDGHMTVIWGGLHPVKTSRP